MSALAGYKNTEMIKENENVAWDPRITYVIGHARPDTDAIAAALGHAWYLSALGTEDVLAARAGSLADQTLFALERFRQDAPPLLGNVAATFGHVAHPAPGVAPGAPLSEAIERLSETERIVPVVTRKGRPLGVVTPLSLARASASGAGALARPCRTLLEEAPLFRAGERLVDHRDALVRVEAEDFLVIDDGGRYLGIATRGRILEPPRSRLILVDHNELSQAVEGVEEAEIVGVLDHHRLGDLQTPAPITILVEPVGSTCTLIAEQCGERGLQPPAALAGVMLSGLLSDTLIFRSPTATERDRTVAEWLAALAGVEIIPYGEDLLRAGSRVAAHSASEILDADRKEYEIGGKSVSIGQVEVADLKELAGRREELLAALQDRREREGLELVCLMITDVIGARSHLLCDAEPRIMSTLPFPPIGEKEFDLGEWVSRKRELVPALHAVLAGTLPASASS